VPLPVQPEHKLVVEGEDLALAAGAEQLIAALEERADELGVQGSAAAT
jgi:hypothetical protein